MKKQLFILLAILPAALFAQVNSTGSTSGSSTGSGSSSSTGTAVSFTQMKGMGLSEVMRGFITDKRYSYFEVSEEMFKAFSEIKDADSATVELFKKIKSVKMLERIYTMDEQAEMDASQEEDTPVDAGFYNAIAGQLDYSGYYQLLKSRNNRTIALLLKKEFGPANNEFLLITNRMVIDIIGDIRIKTIYEMEEMMGMVHQILPN